MIYVFPEGTKVDDPAAVYSGSMNDQCVLAHRRRRHARAGLRRISTTTRATSALPACSCTTARRSPPHTIKTYWLKVPPIHRREPVSMGYIAHAFREVLPGEAVPPFPAERVAALKAADPERGREAGRRTSGTASSPRPRSSTCPTRC